MPKSPDDAPIRGDTLSVRAIVALLAVLAVAALTMAVSGAGSDPDGPARKWWAPPPSLTATEPLEIGGPAADFALPLVRDGRLVRLTDLLGGGKPVVLIFGSFTCQMFEGQRPWLQSLYEQYGNRAEFLTVAVREARHPTQGLEFLLVPPADHEDRRRLVSRAVDLRQWPVPTVLDAEDAHTETAYQAFPTRVVAVRSDGKIDFATTFGSDHHELTRWLAATLDPAPAPQ